MSAPRINYVEVFEELSHPVGMCDSAGNLLLMSRTARELLGVESCDDLSLDLAGRDTFSELRISGLTSREYFLADVPIHGAPQKEVSVTLTPLSSGDFQIQFHTPVDADAASNASVELLRNLCSFEPHVTLFRTGDELVGLYASAFREVFSDYAFVISLRSDAYGEVEQRRAPDDFGDALDIEVEAAEDDGQVAGAQLVWEESLVGHRVNFDLSGQGGGCLQVESASFDGFDQDHLPAFQAFARQLAEAVARRETDDTGLEHDLLAPVLDGLNTMVVVCDEHRHVRASNEAFEAALARDVTELLGRDALELVVEGERSRLRVAAASAIAGENPEPLELELLGGDGALKMQVSPLRPRESASNSAEPRGFVLYARDDDVTLAEIEERIERAEQLMSLGQLATGVAHELKNPLTSILNYAEYLLHKYDEDFFDPDDRDRLRRIVDGVERMDHFVRDLLQLARPDSGEMHRFDVRDQVKRAVHVVRMSTGSDHVDIETDLPDGAVHVYGMSGQFEQVFSNLISNSVKALGDRDGFVRIEVEANEVEAICRVIDDAGGMSEDTLARIFEPFFTTRGSTDGTGLGLALVQAIVNRHRGEIDVDTEFGEGTVFTIRVPTADEVAGEGDS